MKRLSSNTIQVLTLISLTLNSILLIAVIFIAVNMATTNSETKPADTIFTSTSTLDLIALKTSTIIPETPIVDFIAVNTTTIIPETPKVIISRSIKLDPREQINSYVRTISAAYNVDQYLIRSIIQQESEYLPKAKNGECIGLMQVSRYWHSTRAIKLGITDFYDPHDNILLGVDYINELLVAYKDPSLVLMLYNMNHKTALKLYSEGKTTDYAKTILARAEVYRKGG